MIVIVVCLKSLAPLREILHPGGNPHHIVNQGTEAQGLKARVIANGLGPGNSGMEDLEGFLTNAVRLTRGSA